MKRSTLAARYGFASVLIVMIAGCGNGNENESTSTVPEAQPVCVEHQGECRCFDNSLMAPVPREYCQVPAEELLAQNGPGSLRRPDGEEEDEPDFTQPGTWGDRKDPRWSKHIINGRDLGWYGRNGPLVRDDCGKDIFVSVAVGANVNQCANVNYANFCGQAKRTAVAKAQAIPCPSECPHKTPIWDQFAKWGCGPVGNLSRAFCHWQVGFQCLSM